MIGAVFSTVGALVRGGGGFGMFSGTGDKVWIRFEVMSGRGEDVWVGDLARGCCERTLEVRK